MTSGADIGVETRIAPPETAPPAPIAIIASAPPERPVSPLRIVGLVGWQTAVDGSSPYGQQGAAARLGLSRGTYAGGVAAVFGLRSQVVDSFATIELTRHAIALWSEIGVFSSPETTIAVGAQAGLTLFTRSTLSTSPSALPTLSRNTWIPFVGPELRLAFRPAFVAGRGGVSLAAGCDLIPQAPVFGYDVAGSFSPARSLWKVEPRAAVQIELATP
jgi:hypothetical protein